MGDEINAGHLRAFIERIERLNEEKAQLGEDIKEVYAEAKGNGFDVKTIRKIVALRKLDPDERREQDALLEIYLEALGMLADTPLGKAAAERESDRLKNTPKEPKKRGLKAAVASEIDKAVRKLGEPAPLTDEEKRQGMSAAFVGRDGIRMAIGRDVAVGKA
jgi:uncharacterized protein (UPF0335 family)